jgi:hypothetical protein
MKTEFFEDFHSEDDHRETPFKVPEGYFDRFPMKMSHRLQEERQVRHFPFPALLRPAPLVAACATLVLIAVFGYKLFIRQPDQLSQDEISSFVYQEGIIDELDEDDILNYSGIASADSTGFKNLSTEENFVIQHYLIDEDIELNEIIDEL